MLGTSWRILQQHYVNYGRAHDEHYSEGDGHAGGRGTPVDGVALRPCPASTGVPSARGGTRTSSGVPSATGVPSALLHRSALCPPCHVLRPPECPPPGAAPGRPPSSGVPPRPTPRAIPLKPPHFCDHSLSSVRSVVVCSVVALSSRVFSNLESSL